MEPKVSHIRSYPVILNPGICHNGLAFDSKVFSALELSLVLPVMEWKEACIERIINRYRKRKAALMAFKSSSSGFLLSPPAFSSLQ
jgi:hypothetical protein